MPSAYNENIRDPELRSRLAEEGLCDDVVGLILLELIRQFFTSINNFTTHRMRSRNPAMLWTADVATTRVRIVRLEDWDPANMGQTPEIVIATQGTMWNGIQNGGEFDAPEETIDDPTRIVDAVVGRATIWALSKESAEARAISQELGLFISAFSRPIREEYGFTNFRPGGVGNPARIEERAGYWACPVTLAYTWNQTQELLEQQPRLAEIKPEIEVDADQG